MPRPNPDRLIRWRSRPLLLAALCVGSGIVAARQVVMPLEAWLLLLVLFLSAGFLAIVLPRRRLVSLRPLAWTLLLGICLSVLGGLRYAVWEEGTLSELTLAAAEAEELDHSFPVTLSGRVLNEPAIGSRRMRFTLRVDSLGYDQLVSTSGRAEITIWKSRDEAAIPEWPIVRPGHTVAVTGQLRPLPRKRNPGDFDYGDYLRRRGVSAVLSASDSSAVVIHEYEPGKAERAVSRARDYIRATLAEHVPGDESRAVLEALLLADRSRIPPEVRSSFARTGLAHLLAVSGLHVFLVGMVLYGLLKPVLHRLGLTWRVVEVSRAGITLLILGAYVAVVGGPPSAARALVMASALISGKVLERPSNSLNALGAAALVLLLGRPAAIFDVGFQLSFSAVGAIVILMPILEASLPAGWRQRAILRPVTGLVLVSIAATIGTAPVLMAHFGILPLGGILLNLIAIPATAAALGGGLLALVANPVAPGAASAAGFAAYMAASLLLETGLSGVQVLGFSAIDLHVSSAPALLAIVCLIAMIAFWPRPRYRWRSAGAALACVALVVWVPIIKGEHRPLLDVLFLDVGQGDATLVSLPGGRRLLIDAGPWDQFGDAGDRVILPQLNRLSIRQLDAVVVSHPHADHMGGVVSLIRAGAVAELLDNGDEYDSVLYRNKVRVADSAAVTRRALRAGDTIALDDQTRIYVLHPGPEPDAHANDASVVLMLTFGEVRFLFAGDVESAAEETLVHRYRELLCAEVIKVPHHGSRTSSTESLVAAVASCGGPGYAVTKVARRNRYLHPSDEVIQRWAESGAEVVLTSEEGAVWLRSDGRSVWRVHWRRSPRSIHLSTLSDYFRRG